MSTPVPEDRAGVAEHHTGIGEDHEGLRWAVMFARLVLGLMFFMGGFWRVFQLGPLEHAGRFFVGAYAETWLPVWSLWFVGTAIPFVELTAGALLLSGLWRRQALIALGSVLVVVTFGHFLKEPLYAINQHIFPRLVLVLFLLSVPPHLDRFTLDGWRNRQGDTDSP